MLLVGIPNVTPPVPTEPDRRVLIPPEGEIHQAAVVGREQNRELAPGQELDQELVQERGQAWVALTRITLNNELLLADRQEEICQPA